jgi:hypothetical protein
VPIEPLPTRSPPPAFDWSTIEEDGGRRDGHGNTTTSFGLGSPENPTIIDINCEEGDTESEPGSAQCPILIEDPDALPESEDTKLEIGSGSSARHEPAFVSRLERAKAAAE